MAEAADREIAALKKEIETLKKDLKETADRSGDVLASARSKLEAEAEKLMENMRESAGSMGSSLRGAADAVGDNVRRATGAALDQGEQMLHQVEDSIGERPLTSVAVTFGAGFLLGWLMSRK